MAETDVPGIGKTPKKAVILIGGGAAAYVAYRWYGARRASASVAAATPVDTANSAAAQGSASGYTNPGGIPGQAPAAAGLTDNAAWTATVEQDLAGLGYDGQAVALAVGLYLSGQPLTPDQQAIIRVAWGFDGKPPQNTNLAIIPSQAPPAPTPAATPGPAPTPAPTDPHAGQHLQPPQIATLTHGTSLTHYAQGVYGAGYAPHLAILAALNPTLNPLDTTHPTMRIVTSAARWVAN